MDLFDNSINLFIIIITGLYQEFLILVFQKLNFYYSIPGAKDFVLNYLESNDMQHLIHVFLFHLHSYNV